MVLKDDPEKQIQKSEVSKPYSLTIHYIRSTFSLETKFNGELGRINHFLHPCYPLDNSYFAIGFGSLECINFDQVSEKVLKVEKSYIFIKKDLVNFFCSSPEASFECWLFSFFWKNNYYHGRLLPFGTCISLFLSNLFARVII